MSKYTAVYLAVATLLTATPAIADTTGVDACRQLDDDAARLACYDDLFGTIVTGSDIARAALAAPPVVDEKPEVQAASPADEFGKEQVEPERMDRIEAHLVGTFNGWSGSTVFRLDNGQVWRQLKNYAKPYTPRAPIVEPKVTIERGALGSYKLRFEGINRVVLVKRVK